MRIKTRQCWSCLAYTPADADCMACGMTEELAVCGECGGPADDRVVGGMKCGRCAYGYPIAGGEVLTECTCGRWHDLTDIVVVCECGQRLQLASQ